jgi:hypothetical protein
MLREIRVDCPACGETCPLEVDTTGGAEQSYVEDCWVCCRPMHVEVRCRSGEVVSIQVNTD